jgi:hypothetical protein
LDATARLPGRRESNINPTLPVLLNTLSRRMRLMVRCTFQVLA